MKKKIIYFLFGMMACITIGVSAAIVINARDVGYIDNKNVEQALNDLYSKSNYGNVNASDIKTGKTALSNGKRVTGSMPDWSENPQKIDSVRIANNRLEVAVAKGYHDHNFDENSYEYLEYDQVANAIGLTANKIVKGNTILGVSGTGSSAVVTSFVTLQYVDASTARYNSGYSGYNYVGIISIDRLYANSNVNGCGSNCGNSVSASINSSGVITVKVTNPYNKFQSAYPPRATFLLAKI